MKTSIVQTAAAFFIAASSLAAQGPGGANATQIKPGESCPPGMTEIRPRRCMAPASAPPSILDYRPRSTLVTATHFVRAAKYPVIDFHGHAAELLATPATISGLRASLDSLNVRVIVIPDNLSGERLQRAVAAVRASPEMKDRVRILAGVDFRNVGPGWAEKAIAQLHADLAAGAVGIGEIPKSFGLSVKKPDGTR